MTIWMKSALSLFTLSSLLFAFNNCGEMNSVSKSGSKSFASNSITAICDQQLKAAFQRTYHPFLVANCQGCHSMAHGSSNLDVSYQAFAQRGAPLIEYQATHAHGGNNFTEAKQAEINEFKPEWTSAQADYLECLNSSVRGEDQVGFAQNLKITGKPFPNLMGTLNNNNWVNAEWDLETSVETMYLGEFKVILRAEARLNRVNGVAAGIFIRNPTMRLKSGSSNIEVSGLMISIDGVKQTLVTTYSGISKIIATTSNTALVDGVASGSAYLSFAAVSATTNIGFELNEIKHTSLQPPPIAGPPPVNPVPVPIPDVPIPAGGVKHSQLTSSSSPYRVFNRSCVGCHNSGSGRLDLTNYEAAAAAASLITQRMNNSSMPMPPTGLLRQNDRDLVQSWVNSGVQR